MRLIVLVLFLASFVSSLAQINDPFTWGRLPSDREMNQLIDDYIKQKSGAVSVNDQVVDNPQAYRSEIIKFHDKRLAGQRPPHTISSAKVIVSFSNIMGK
jgi:hypothetical protein